MKKYFFFDIDNTLSVGTTKVVPPDTLACLEQLRAAGHFVSIATGRLQCDSIGFAQKLGIDTFVADGGQSLTINGKIREMTGLPRKNCLAFLHDLDELQLPWAIVTENKLIRHTRGGYFAEPAHRSYFKTVVHPIDLASTPVIYKIFVARPQNDLPIPHWHGLSYIPYFDGNFLVEPMDKAAGIRRLLPYLGGQPQDVVVFGDGHNDINLFSPDWFCIAMGNAKDTLKEKADFITGDCDKGGILAACQKFHWLDPIV